ncbi:hypothetical protein AURDEDRAFT_155200, partial [Auricularia subglabra TFB-10046 SS5]
SYQHLEAFTGLTNDITTRLIAIGAPRLAEQTVNVTTAKFAPREKVSLLENQYPQLLNSQCLILHLTSINYIFFLGALAVLKVLKRLTGSCAFDIGEHVLGDLQSVAFHHWSTIAVANATATTFLHAAMDIEVTVTLALLQGSFRHEVHEQMMIMFSSIPPLCRRVR